MAKPDKETYDVIIIGAGMSGLVCGCYLAKAGLRVLIAEQHHKPGGYCTSFQRGRFTFDAAAHSFGGYTYGNLGKIFRDLGIDNKIIIKKYDPSNVITSPDHTVSFWTDVDKTIDSFQSAFPKDAENIKRFFHFLTEPDSMSFARIRRWTFKDLLDNYFTNDRIQAMLSFPLYGNGALPPSRMSAFIGARIFKEFLLDGGYHPAGGMQMLADALALIFKEAGGELQLSTTVKKINLKNNEVAGVVLEKDDFVPSRYVISNSDARQTFLTMLGKNNVEQEFKDRMAHMVPSLSTFIVYLGVDQSAKTLPVSGVNYWYLSQYDLLNTYLSAKKGDFRDMGRYLVHVSPDRSTVIAFMNAPYKSKKYWETNRTMLSDKLIKVVEANTIPELSKYIIYKETATPRTLQRYTLNYAGSAYGWESTPFQLADPDFRKPSFIRGLYLTGHWTTHGLGIPGVAYVGYDTAKMVLRKNAHSCQKMLN